MDKFSYSLGLSLGQSMIGTGVEKIDFESFISGLKDVYTNNPNPQISPEEGNKILDEYFSKKKSEKEIQLQKEREENLKTAKEFLNQNRVQDGVTETASGLQYRRLKVAEGEKKRLTPHSRVKCHYEGRFTDGKIFDSSYRRGEPAVFSLERVIPGWTEGLQLMGVGDKYEFVIPPQLGYGEVGIPGHIPGNSVLIFTVELLDVVE